MIKILNKEKYVKEYRKDYKKERKENKNKIENEFKWISVATGEITEKLEFRHLCSKDRDDNIWIDLTWMYNKKGW